MKLRFDHQSIRLRVRKSDVEKLSLAGFIEETVYFPQGRLVFRLEISQDTDAVQAVIQQETITVKLPESQASAWMLSEAVGIYATLSTMPEGNHLEVLVEKDFPCKHNTDADNADTFDALSTG